MKTYKPGQIITLKGGVKLRAVKDESGEFFIGSCKKCYFFQNSLRKLCMSVRCYTLHFEEIDK